MNSCTICLEKFTESSSEIILGCSHKYHVNCIIENMTHGTSPDNCPLCRREIDANNWVIKLSKEFRLNYEKKILRKKNILKKLTN